MSVATDESLEDHGYRQYRAPKDPNTALVDPVRKTLEATFANREGFSKSSAKLEFCGTTLSQMREETRREAVELAIQHTSVYSSPVSLSPEEIASKSIVLTGHQPELFHAGVWFKNFLADSVAKANGAIAINFLVDNDLCRDTTIRVPKQGADGSLSVETVRFDDRRTTTPWELRSIESHETWSAFPDAVSNELGSLCDREPLLQHLWPLTRDCIDRTGNVGHTLAEARHRLELEQGFETLETSLSALVSTRSFARFSLQIISELPRFQGVYNLERERYRSAHKIRNEAHPVPPLEEREGWIEGPWWVYRPESPTRQRLWFRMQDERLFLSDRLGWQEVIEGKLDSEDAASQWLGILAESVRLRPRALLTTMYLRLFVSDLFVHGIGGGKYDQLTDGIAREFFGIELTPPMVATATLRLPVEHLALGETSASESRIRECQETIWRYRNGSMREFSSLPGADKTEAKQLVEEKRQLLTAIPERGEKWDWHQKMTRVNKRLVALSQEPIELLEREMESLNAKLRQQAIANSREYSYCLYPLEEVFATLRRLAEN